MLTLLACAKDPGSFVLYAPPADAEALAAFVATIGDPRLRVEAADDPEASARRSAAQLAAAVSSSGGTPESWEVTDEGGHFVVTGGGLLGARYGVAELLEAHGYRFYHPQHTWIPEAVELVDAGALGRQHVPTMGRRGIHLHTLHPIDGLWAYWTGEDDDAAADVMDWVVRNRGNHLQWVGLDDVTTDLEEGTGLRYDDWVSDTAALLDRAHGQGLTTGLGVQLFGSSNLQLAFDLVDEPGPVEEMRPSLEARLGSVTDGLAWDHLSLSFGEFSGVDPDAFVAAANLFAEVAAEKLPDATMSGTIHVGNYDDLRVEYQGEELQYYFLVQYADPRIVPWVHSVMYFNLYETAAGAYAHDEFDEHRTFLEDRLRAGEPVGYHPETAYWVAFDNSVPTWLPVYAWSRAYDLERLAAAVPEGALQDQVLFSTGWEWGYWQNDYLALRVSVSPEHTLDGEVATMFRPLGEVGAAMEATFQAMLDAQHTELIQHELAPFLAGRDDVIDLGDALGIIAAPDRPEFTELAGLAQGERDALRAALVDGSFSTAFDLDTSGLDPANPFAAEMRDGVEVTKLRAAFVTRLYAAALDHVEGGDGTPGLAEAATLLDAAREVVARRHAALHATQAERLLVPAANPTFYPRGYLSFADTLCYWERELAQVENLVRGTGVAEPGCFP